MRSSFGKAFPSPIPVLILTTLTTFITGCHIASTPIEGTQWFATMVEVDPAPFENIQHFTIQDIDFSHHFKFTYTNRDELEAIIQQQTLSLDSNRAAFNPELMPAWFAPTAEMTVYSDFNRSDAVVVLWIDDASNTAYFEYVKI